MQEDNGYVPVIKKRLAVLWQKDKLIICIGAVFLITLLLSNHFGYRICNCASTEKWEPGTARTAGGRSGVNHFYHK